MKWHGFGHCSDNPSTGELALFCPVCPQPGINVLLSEDESLDEQVPFTTNAPQVPCSPGSPKKQNFGPASMTAGSHPEVTVSHFHLSGTHVYYFSCIKNLPSAILRLQQPPAVVQKWLSPLMILPALWMVNLLLFPPLISPFLAQTTSAIIALRKSGPARLVWTGGPAIPVYLVSGAPPRRSDVSLHLWEPCPNMSELRVWTHSQSHSISHTPAIPAVTTPKVQSYGCSKTITSRKTPTSAPASAPASVSSSSFAVPYAALDVPMPDLYFIAIAIRDGAAHITILEAHVQEQDGKIDTLQCLHKSLWRQVVNPHEFSILVLAMCFVNMMSSR
ncbi:hypothetical protein EDD22DRAFT_958288 [Suillus occidentalis]|nr:hypothetical protein EDD22DRAFT_958288 [Suillus occidentalis]